MRESGFPNADEVTHKIAGGFDVVGALSSSVAFAPQPRTEACSIETLWRGAKAMQRTVIDSMRPSGDDQVDAAVTKTTEDDVANGWLTGPRTEKQLSDKQGLLVPVPRFGVKQGDSVRAVDDYTFAGQNGATSVAEKIDAGGVDVVWIARCLLLAEPGGDINIQLSTGEVTSAPIHPDSTKEGLAVVGRVWDFSKAYRQLARNPAHAAFTVVASWCSRSRTTKLYEQHVLAFGATSSVMSFCLVAKGSLACGSRFGAQHVDTLR